MSQAHVKEKKKKTFYNERFAKITHSFFFLPYTSYVLMIGDCKIVR